MRPKVKELEDGTILVFYGTQDKTYTPEEAEDHANDLLDAVQYIRTAASEHGDNEWRAKKNGV